MIGYRQVLGAAFLLMSAPLLYSVISFAAKPRPRGAWLEAATSGTTCILPRAEMRLHHMTYLKDLRDEVVRDGRRPRSAAPHPQGISSCRGCHAHRELFCDRCHERASVQPDCFGCHGY